MADHDCPGGCGAQVPVHQLSCKPCWWRLPKPLRDALNTAYRIRHKAPASPVEIIPLRRSHRADTLLSLPLCLVPDSIAHVTDALRRPLPLRGGAR